MINLNLEGQGENLTFFSEADPSAPSLEFECSTAPGKKGPERHSHPLQTEIFHVTKGRMHAVVNGEDILIEEGEKLIVSPGQVHSFSNPDPNDPLTMRITIEPALNFQWFLTESARSAIRNGGSWRNVPLLEIAYILDQVVDEHDYPGLSPRMKRILFRTLARLAVLLRKTREVAPLPQPRAVR